MSIAPDEAARLAEALEAVPDRVEKLSKRVAALTETVRVSRKVGWTIAGLLLAVTILGYFAAANWAAARAAQGEARDICLSANARRAEDMKFWKLIAPLLDNDADVRTVVLNAKAKLDAPADCHHISRTHP